MIIRVHISGFFITDLCLFFCRLKINHDYHEFILEFGTVANIYHEDSLRIVSCSVAFIEVELSERMQLWPKFGYVAEHSNITVLS